MSRKIYASILTLLVAVAASLLTSCSSSSYKTPPVVSVAVSSGSGQSATVSTPFGAPLVAVVTTGGTPTSGVAVTFTAPSSGASGTFSGGPATEQDTTDANGQATSSTFTANSTSGAYSVTASATGASGSATFSLTNNAVSTGSNNYVFNVSGEEAINSGPNYYAIAGVVTIDSNGNVLAGEQDYNDAFGITSPEPSGDSITGGTLTVDSTTGQGTLTLITDNSNLGASGTETFGVQFANPNHALIMQFDGTATSSGSLDLQTLASTGGNFAFTFTGVDNIYCPVTFGGVYSASSGTITGVMDVNDCGNVFTSNALNATSSSPDAFGRGTVTGVSNPGTATAVALNYYIVGPETVRIIDVDAADAAVGSAYGQGSGTFSNASLGASVLTVAGNPWTPEYGALAQFTTSNTGSDPASFSGVGDDDELDFDVFAEAAAVSGTYSIASDGYGSLTFTGGLGGGDVGTVGVYMTDPALNLNDPNNPSGGGGALVLDMFNPGGTGVIVPQTDTATASFDGNYAVGWQNFNYFSSCGDCEFDMVAQGSVTGGALSLTGLVSDPFLTLGTPHTTSVADTFSGTPLADGSNPGRYSMLSTNVVPNSLATVIDGSPVDFDLVMYQASGGQLFWLEFDTSD